MITEDHPYIAARLKLLAALAKYGAGSLQIKDVERAKDKTCVMVGNWRAARTEEAKLRAETLRCVTFTAKGKIEVHDPETLEALNARISHLLEVREAIERAVAILQDKAPGYLKELEAAKMAAERAIEDAPIGLNRALGIELKDFHATTPEAAMKSHRYLRAKEQSEATIKNAKTRLEALEPQIALIGEQLAAVEKVMGGPLKAERVSAQGNYATAITREKAGVMG